jgi:DNA-binding HxlR family transcriptional regulator
MQSVADKRRRHIPSSTSDPAAGKHAINAAIGIFHRRWAMRVLWELRVGPVTFRALQEACAGVSPAVLNVRLRELRDADLVIHEDGRGYALTQWGAELLVATRPLMSWAVRWWSSQQDRSGRPASLQARRKT